MSVTKESVDRVKRLRRLREFEERERRQDYAVALGKERDGEERVEALRLVVDERQDLLRKALTGGTLVPRAFFDLYAAMDDAANAVDQARSILDGARRERIAKENLWREARKKCLALEKLEERRRAQWNEQQQLAEKKLRDEVALARYARSKAMATEVRGEAS